jgi:hypothetical protein
MPGMFAVLIKAQHKLLYRFKISHIIPHAQMRLFTLINLKLNSIKHLI